MSDCNLKDLIENCPCSYTSCSRKGKCCQCIEYHLKMNELPGCAFSKISKDAEKTYNRNFEYFARLVLKKKDR